METSQGAAEPYQVAFENEFVRIVNVALTAGQKPPKYVAAALPMVSIDVAADDRGVIRGNTRYIDDASQQDHPSARAVREIRVELKAAPKAAPMALDAVRVDPARYRVDFENDRVRVVRLHFAAHEKGLMVSHPPRVLVTLTDVAVKLKFSDGRTDERGAPAAAAGWLESETLQTENAGSQTLEVVLIEPKSRAGF